MKINKMKQLNIKLMSITFVIIGILTLGLSNAYSQVKTDVTNMRGSQEEIKIEGPGALFIARVKDGIGFWVISAKDEKPIRVGKGKRIVVIIRNLSSIIFDDGITTDLLKTIRFSGKLENKNCPTCTVIMPISLSTPVERRDMKFFENISNFEENLRTRILDYEWLGTLLEDYYSNQK